MTAASLAITLQVRDYNKVLAPLRRLNGTEAREWAKARGIEEKDCGGPRQAGSKGQGRDRTVRSGPVVEARPPHAIADVRIGLDKPDPPGRWSTAISARIGQ
jgi:hypothetical protein